MSVDDLKRLRGKAWSVAFDAIVAKIEDIPLEEDGIDAASLCEAAVSAIEALSPKGVDIAGFDEVSMLRASGNAWSDDDFPDLTAREKSLLERGIAERIAASEVRRLSDVMEKAAVAIETRDAMLLSQAARIASLEARVAALETGDTVLPEYSETYWQEAIGGTYKPAAWGKHEAIHPVRVKEAIALAIEHAPACGDVIVSQIFFGIVARNREARLINMLNDAQAGDGSEESSPATS